MTSYSWTVYKLGVLYTLIPASETEFFILILRMLGNFWEDTADL